MPRYYLELYSKFRGERMGVGRFMRAKSNVAALKMAKPKEKVYRVKKGYRVPKAFNTRLLVRSGRLKPVSKRK